MHSLKVKLVLNPSLAMEQLLLLLLLHAAQMWKKKDVLSLSLSLALIEIHFLKNVVERKVKSALDFIEISHKCD